MGLLQSKITKAFAANSVVLPLIFTDYPVKMQAEQHEFTFADGYLTVINE